MEQASERRWLRLSLGLALLLGLPALATGLFVDDYYHLALSRGMPAPGSAPFELFCFAKDPARTRAVMEQGIYPWWTLPELRLSFFRPLSSALATADYRLFGTAAVLPHLHSLLWYLLLIGACARLLRRALPGAWGLGLLLFAVDPTHWVTAAWLANRNALVAACCAAWGLVAHLRWREEGWRPGLPLSLLGYALGLCGGEVALGVFAYLGTYELWAGPGGAAGKARGLAPALLLGLGYVALYKAFGYGASGSGIYLDPTRSPLAYLAAAPGRALVLAGGAVLELQTDLWLLVPATRVPLAVCGALSLLLLAGMLRWAWPRLEAAERRGLGWLLPGAALALLPNLATFPANRMLLVPSLGVDAALGCALLLAWRARAERRAAVLVPAGLLALAHLGTPLAAWPLSSYVIRSLGDAVLAAEAAAEIDDARVAQQRLVVLVAPDPALGFYVPVLRAVERKPLPAAWRVLSMAHHNHRFTRTGPATLEMEVVGGEMLGNLFEALVRDPGHPLRAGEVVEVSGMRATVLEVGAQGPRRVRFDFDRPLEDPSLAFLVWHGGRLRRIAPPALGQSLDWRWEPGALPM